MWENKNTVAVWLAGVSMIQDFIVFVLSIKYGMGGWSKLDMLCLLIALLGIVAWQTTNNPLLGLYCSILADFTGMIPALVKTYKMPDTEIVTFYALDIVAAFFSLLATTVLSLENIAYPVYIFCINFLMCFLIIRPSLAALSSLNK